MLQIKKEGVLLQGTDHYFENGGVLNPAVYQEGRIVHLFYRGIHMGAVATIGYCTLDGPLALSYRREEPLLEPEFAYEAFGIEDPRIVKIDDTWYLTYAGWDGQYARGAIATSTDMVLFKKTGPFFPRWTYEQFYAVVSKENVDERYFSFDQIATTPLWCKNIVFFPRRINGKLFMLHRIRPGILIAEFDEIADLTEDYWKRYFREMSRHILLDPIYSFESHIMGAGCPPIETKDGWLVIYHGVEDKCGGYMYAACAALLDIHDPRKVIGRLPYPLFLPEEPWEKKGQTNNVVFPTGSALFGNRLYIYYGAADCRIAVASLDIDELLHELIRTRL
jgi:predicted GH43/DUF377 family glycosyl hydrolase